MDVCYRVRCKPASWVLDVISGRCRGPAVAMARALLAGSAGLYGVAVRLRNQAYDRGLLSVHDAGVPVVSVGNLTTGGTGKTPMVAWLVRLLQRQGWRPGIVSRGYRGCRPTDIAAGAAFCGHPAGPSLHASASREALASRAVNDEYLVLKRLCGDVPHIQAADRLAAARRLIHEFACDCIVADDAFQHRRLRRDCDIVLIDATNPWGYGRLLPRGLLREPCSALRRADAVVVTRADGVGSSELAGVRHEIERWKRPDVPVVTARFDVSGVLAPDGASKTPNVVLQPVLGFCGIGNPEGFRATLERCGFAVTRLCVFPDHWQYRPDDLAWLIEQARSTGARSALTTLKDMVKLGAWPSEQLPLFALRQTVAVEAAESLTAVIAARIERIRDAAAA